MSETGGGGGGGGTGMTEFEALIKNIGDKLEQLAESAQRSETAVNRLADVNSTKKLSDELAASAISLDKFVKALEKAGRRDGKGTEAIERGINKINETILGIDTRKLGQLNRALQQQRDLMQAIVGLGTEQRAVINNTIKVANESQVAVVSMLTGLKNASSEVKDLGEEIQKALAAFNFDSAITNIDALVGKLNALKPDNFQQAAAAFTEMRDAINSMSMSRLSQLNALSSRIGRRGTPEVLQAGDAAPPKRKYTRSNPKNNEGASVEEVVLGSGKLERELASIPHPSAPTTSAIVAKIKEGLAKSTVAGAADLFKDSAKLTQEIDDAIKEVGDGLTIKTRKLLLDYRKSLKLAGVAEGVVDQRVIDAVALADFDKIIADLIVGAVTNDAKKLKAAKVNLPSSIAERIMRAYTAEFDSLDADITKRLATLLAPAKPATVASKGRSVDIERDRAYVGEAVQGVSSVKEAEALITSIKADIRKLNKTRAQLKSTLEHDSSVEGQSMRRVLAQGYVERVELRDTAGMSDEDLARRKTDLTEKATLLTRSSLPGYGAELHESSLAAVAKYVKGFEDLMDRVATALALPDAKDSAAMLEATLKGIGLELVDVERLATRARSDASRQGDMSEKVDGLAESLSVVDAQFLATIDQLDSLNFTLDTLETKLKAMRAAAAEAATAAALESVRPQPQSSSGASAAALPVSPGSVSGADDVSAQRAGLAFTDGGQRLAAAAPSFGSGLISSLLGGLSDLWNSLGSLPKHLMSFADKFAVATKAAEDALHQAIAATPFAGAYESIRKFAQLLADSVQKLADAGQAAVLGARKYTDDIAEAHAMMQKIAGGKYVGRMADLAARTMTPAILKKKVNVTEDPATWGQAPAGYVKEKDRAGALFAADTTKASITDSERAAINHQVVLEALKASTHGIAVLRNSRSGEGGLGHSSVAIESASDPKGYILRQFFADLETGLTIDQKAQNDPNKSGTLDANYMEAVGLKLESAQEAIKFLTALDETTAPNQKYGFTAQNGELTCSSAVVKAANMSGVIPESMLPARVGMFNTATPDSVIHAMTVRNRLLAGEDVQRDPLSYTPMPRRVMSAMRSGTSAVVPTPAQFDDMGDTFSKMDVGNAPVNKQLGFIGKLIKNVKEFADFSFDALADAIEILNKQLRGIDVTGSFKEMTDAIQAFSAKLRSDMSNLDTLGEQLGYLKDTASDIGKDAKRDVGHKVARVVDKARDTVETANKPTYILDTTDEDEQRERVKRTSEQYHNAIAARHAAAAEFNSVGNIPSEDTAGLAEGTSSNATLQTLFEGFLASRSDFAVTNSASVEMLERSLASEVTQLNQLTAANKAARDTFNWVEGVARAGKPLTEISQHDSVFGSETNQLLADVSKAGGADAAGKVIDDFMAVLKRLDRAAFDDFADGFSKLKQALRTFDSGDIDRARTAIQGGIALRYSAGSPSDSVMSGPVFEEFGSKISAVIATGFSASERFNALGRASASVMGEAGTADEVRATLSAFAGAVQHVDPVIFTQLESSLKELDAAVQSADLAKFDAALDKLSAHMFATSLASQAVTPVVQTAEQEEQQAAADPIMLEGIRKSTQSDLSAMKSGNTVIDKLASGYGAFTFYNTQFGAALKGVQQFLVASREINTGTIVDMAGAILKIGGSLQNSVFKATGERGRNDQNKPLFSGYAEKGRGDTILSFLDAGLRIFGGSLGIPIGKGAKGGGGAKGDGEEKTPRKILTPEDMAARTRAVEAERDAAAAKRKAEKERLAAEAAPRFTTQTEAAAYVTDQWAANRFKGQDLKYSADKAEARRNTISDLVTTRGIDPNSKGFQKWWSKLDDNQRQNLPKNADMITLAYYTELEKANLHMFDQQKAHFAQLKAHVAKYPNLTKDWDDFQAYLKTKNLEALEKRKAAEAKAAGAAGGSTPPPAGDGVSAMLSGGPSTNDEISRFMGVLSDADRARSKTAEQAILDMGKGTGIERIMQKGGYLVVTEQSMLESFENAFGAMSAKTGSLKSLMAVEGGYQGATFHAGDQVVGMTVAGKEAVNGMSAGQTAAHELTHVVTKQLMDKSPEARKALEGAVLNASRDRFKEVYEDSSQMEAAVKQASTVANGKFVAIAELFPTELSYYFNEEEVMANVGQAMLSGSKEVEALFRSLYGDKMFDRIGQILATVAPDIYSGPQLADIQSRFGDMDTAMTDAVHSVATPREASAAEQAQQVLSEIGGFLQNAVSNLDFSNVEKAFAVLQDDPAISGIASAVSKSLHDSGTLFEHMAEDAVMSAEVRAAFTDMIKNPTARAFSAMAGQLGSLAYQRTQADLGIGGKAAEVVLGKQYSSTLNTRTVGSDVSDSILYHTGAAIGREYGPQQPYRYFDEFSNAFKGKTGESLLKSGFQVSESFDMETGLTKLTASARTSSGATTQLAATIDRFGRVEVDTSSKFKSMISRFREEIAQEIPETIIEGFISGLQQGIEELFRQVLDIQDEIAQVNLLMEDIGKDIPGFDALKESQLFVQGAIELAAKTGQGFEESIKTIIHNFRTLGSITDGVARQGIATRLTEVQLGSQSVFGLSLEKSLEIIPAIFSQLKDQVAKAPGGDTKDAASIATEATTNLENLMDKLVVAQQESGANAEDLIQIYADLSSSAKDKGISSDDLIALSASAAVKLGTSPAETSNVMKMFIERLYSSEGASKLGEYGIATREVDPESGKLRFRNINTILDEINSVEAANPAAASEINRVLGAQRNAPEAGKIIASRAEGSRVREVLDTGVEGGEYEERLKTVSDKFLGNLNTLKANFGSFIQTTVFSSGMINDFGAALEKLSTYAASLSSFLTHNSGIMDAMKPIVMGLAKALLFIAIDAGKAFGGMIGTINKLLLTTKDIVNRFQNQALFPEDNMLRTAKATVAVINELEQLQAAGKLTDTALHQATQSMSLAFKQLGLDVDEVKASLTQLGAVAANTAVAGAIASDSAVSPQLAGRNRVQPKPASRFITATQTSMFDDGVDFSGRTTPLVDKAAALSFVANAQKAKVRKAEADALQEEVRRSQVTRTISSGVTGRRRGANAGLPERVSATSSTLEQVSMTDLLSDVDTKNAAYAAAKKAELEAMQASTEAQHRATTATQASTTVVQAASTAKRTETASTNDTVAGLTKLKIFLNGTMSRTATGVSSFWGSQVGKTTATVGSVAADLMLPAATDLMLGGFNVETATKVGMGIAGGITGTLLGGGNPIGTMIGYQMGTAFNSVIDIPGIAGGSSKERNASADMAADLLARNKARADAIVGKSPEEIAQYDREQKELEDKAEADRLSRIAAARKVLVSNLPMDVINSSTRVDDLKARANMSPEQREAERVEAEARRARMRQRYPQMSEAMILQSERVAGLDKTVLDDELARLEKIPGLVQAIKDSTATNGQFLLGEFAQNMLFSDETVQTAIDKSDWGSPIEETDTGNTGNTGIGFTDTAEDIIRRYESRRGSLAAEYERATTVPDMAAFDEMSQFGPVSQKLDATFKPQLAGIAAGRITGEDAAQVMSQYDLGRASLEGVPQLEKTTEYVASALGQSLTDLRQSLYDIGPEGQTAFGTIINKMAEMVSFTDEYKLKLEEIAYIQSNPIYVSGAGTEGYDDLAARLAQLQEETGAVKEKYEYESKFLDLYRTSPDSIQKRITDIKTETKARAVLKSPGTPSEFRMPSLVDVTGNTTDDIRKAIDAAKAKQADIVRMFPEMAKTFRQEQFMLESGGQYRGVTGVSQDYFNEALQETKAKKLTAPGTVDLSDKTPEQQAAILASARAMQAQAVALAPDLADTYKDERLLIMQKNNQLIMENGLSQEYLQAAIDANTKATDGNTDGLRGHYNLPSSYRPPTIWDYYDQGGTEAGSKNFVPPSQGITMDMATNIANAVLANGAGTEDTVPDLSGLGGLEEGSTRLGWTEGKAPVWEMPPKMEVDTTNITLNDIDLEAALLRQREGEREPHVKPEKGGKNTVEAENTFSSLSRIVRTSTDDLGLWGRSTYDIISKQTSAAGLLSSVVGAASSNTASQMDTLAAAVTVAARKLASFDPAAVFAGALNSGRIQIIINGQPAAITTKTIQPTGSGGPGYTGGSGRTH